VEQLRVALSDAGARQGSRVAILVFDLDGFTKLNNALGHAFGDRCIRRVSDLLGASLREEHAAARIGPDEFAILIADCKSAGVVSRFAARLQEDLGSAFRIETDEAAISASIGIAIGSSDEGSAEDLLRNAGTALESARGQGGGRHVLFEPTMHSAAMSELRLERDLRAGIRRGELLGVYQPIVDLLSGEVEGFEALIRWRHPDKGVLSAGEFLPMAERTGLVIALDRWCMRNAMSWLKIVQGRLASPRPVLLNVNLSSLEFSREDLVEFVARQLRETGADPACVSLEVTESAMMEDPGRASRLLSELKALGVHLALDDFGTGYSSLSYLQKLPLDSVKIDRSFVWNISASRKNLEIVRTVLNLTQTLGMKVIAEGIETEEQLQLLRSLGCRRGQGFLFSPPVEAPEAERLLLTGIGRAALASPNRSRRTAGGEA
jgi:diguanylate cyclase (GGDEF)-like protein